MSRKVKAMLYVTIMVVSLSAAAILYMLMPACENCGRKFCFGTCIIEYGNLNPLSARPNQPKTNQTTTRLAETEKVDAETYFKNVYFIGDSRTNALKLYGVPQDHIFAEDGLNHERALTAECVRLDDRKIVSIPDAVMITAPKIMIINFGINGASFWGKDEFIEKYETLVDTLLERSPNSIVVIESILPVSLGYEQKEGGCSNEKIDELNDALYEMAKEKGFYYMATNEAMKNDYNDLVDNYHDGGGLHYNSKGNEQIINYVLTHAILFD